jgi:DNA-binding protein HU-beta
MNKTTTYNQSIKLVAEKLNCFHKDVKYVLDTYRDVLVEELSKGNQVRFFNTMTLENKEHKARNGFNPRTGEKLVIPASKRVSIKPSKVLNKDVKLMSETKIFVD